jgi:hypothetical protein
MNRRVHHALVMLAVLVASPAVAVGQTLTELGAANAARNEMISNGGAAARAGANAEAPAPSGPAAGTQAGSAMKYTLAYALAGMLVGLGMYIVCRPSNRHATD